MTLFDQQPVVLVDGSYLLHRSVNHPVYKRFSTPAGIPTGGIFGFIETVRKLAKDYSLSIAVAWEGGGASKKRSELYREYKANRDYKEVVGGWKIEEGSIVIAGELDGFMLQQALVNLILFHLKIPACFAAGYEADDLLATWSRIVGEHPSGGHAYIYTTDHDLWQCVGERCSVINPLQKGETQVVSHSTIAASHGNAKNVVWVKVLRGDSSDNFGGAPVFWPSASGDDGKMGMLPPRMVTALLQDRLFQQVGTFDDLVEYLKSPPEGSPLMSHPEFRVTEASVSAMKRNYDLAQLEYNIESVSALRPSEEFVTAFPTLQSVFDLLAMKKWSKSPDVWSKIASAVRHPAIQPQQRGE